MQQADEGIAIYAVPLMTLRPPGPGRYLSVERLRVKERILPLQSFNISLGEILALLGVVSFFLRRVMLCGESFEQELILSFS
ncbi:hypothetical protein ACFFK0_22320 [Paenibacillus chartarius]|uniref:Uncharacterized protein n=1 Tax=Paenibacillus chartarius TaxID=747481 RepID=A0ABV6DR58_9BACL